MTNTAYTSTQSAFAGRVSKALAGVPDDKRPMLETVVESVLMGAAVATSPAPPTFPPPGAGPEGGPTPVGCPAP